VADRLKTIIDELSVGVPVLTVNRRLERYLLASHEKAMAEAGQNLWKSPVVMPLLSWVKGLWEESWPEGSLLSDTRSLALWKKIVSRDRRTRGLLFPRGAAREAYKAYELVRRYRLRLPADDTYLTEEARAFKGWLGQYENELQRLGFVDYPCLMERVCALMDGGTVTLPEKVILAGFDEITPDVEALLASLKGAGCKALFWPEEPGAKGLAAGDKRAATEIREYGDELQEVRSCARWARLQAEDHKRVGIIVPELDRYRAIIINEFFAELDPASILPGEPRRESFNISLGLPLDREPIVCSAIEIISVGSGELPVQTMGSLLSSPYFMSDVEEFVATASFLRQFGERHYGGITLRGLKRAMDRENTGPLGRLSERLGVWEKALEDNRGAKRLPGFWAGFFDAFLKALAWPSSGVTLGSGEFQALTAWHNLLSEFAGLDDVLGRLTWAGAAAELRAMAGEAIHQGETVSESPVEVLGLLESSGLSFDAIWILGAHEAALPARCAPNPFIPVYLQKKAGLPRVSPEQALEFDRVALGRVLKSAPLAVVSFPRVVEGKEHKVSPLFSGEGSFLKDPPPLPGHRFSDSVHASYAAVPLIDDEGVPFGAEELKGLRGGTGIIKEQSACPFRAFAIYRLGARPPGVPLPGLDAMERGSTAHEALNIFWGKTKDSEGLAEAHKQGRLTSIIGEAVEEALAGFKRPGLSEKILALEAERLQGLLKAWMEVELKRGEFVVVERESEQEIEVEGLKIHARLDRVDELPGGGRIIIDYKTGPCNKDYWLPGRPKEPQMLLYAFDGGFNAIAFASLDNGVRPSFVGVARDDGMLPKVKGIESDDKWRGHLEGVQNWADLNERWKETLKGLAKEFIRGEAPVDPNKTLGESNSPCKYCELEILCRRGELGFLNEEEEEGPSL